MAPTGSLLQHCHRCTEHWPRSHMALSQHPELSHALSSPPLPMLALKSQSKVSPLPCQGTFLRLSNLLWQQLRYLQRTLFPVVGFFPFLDVPHRHIHVLCPPGDGPVQDALSQPQVFSRCQSPGSIPRKQASPHCLPWPLSDAWQRWLRSGEPC